MKVMIYLCEKHAKGLAPKSPMTDDVLICQVPVCFRLATWKYFADIPRKYNTRNPRSAQEATTTRPAVYPVTTSPIRQSGTE